MKIEISDITTAINLNRFNITLHARKEAKEDFLLLEQILSSVINGEIIEDYQDDKPYPSCLVYGKIFERDPIHSVWGYDFENRIAILITVYCPDSNRWIDFKKRRL